MAKRNALNGYELPAGISTDADVKRMQRELGVTADGVWGPNTQAAYQNYKRQQVQGIDWDQRDTAGRGVYIQQQNRKEAGNTGTGGRPSGGNGLDDGAGAGIDLGDREQVKYWQRRLGVTADGVWGPNTQAAYQNYKRQQVQGIDWDQRDTAGRGTYIQQQNAARERQKREELEKTVVDMKLEVSQLDVPNYQKNQIEDFLDFVGNAVKGGGDLGELNQQLLDMMQEMGMETLEEAPAPVLGPRQRRDPVPTYYWNSAGLGVSGIGGQIAGTWTPPGRDQAGAPSANQ